MLPATTLFAARGRSLARLVDGLSNGEPGAWITLVAVVAIAGGIYGFKLYRSRQQANNG